MTHSVLVNNISNINQSLDNKLRTKGNKKKAVEPTIAYLPFNKIGCEALQDKGTPKYTRNILLATTFVIYLTTTKSTVKVKAPY
jgi:hypothetical protein